MISPVEIPKLTLTMEGASLLRWLKKEGEWVEKNEALLELETDKATVEMPSPAGGLLRKVVIQNGEVAVGAIVGYIGEASDVVPDPGVAPRLQVTLSEPVIQASSDSANSGPGMVRATPAARRRAKELGQSLAGIVGTGPDGRITQEDVERAAGQSKGDRDSLGPSLRTLIAERTAHAWRNVPHIHIGGHIRAEGLKAALEKGKKTIEADLSMTDLLLYAVALTLPNFPALNSVWCDNGPQPQPQIHLAFAVQTSRGVITPVIRDAERRSLAEISKERKRLVDGASTRSLKSADLDGGTFTLTNLGMYPVDFFAPIINYPQSAILATGRVKSWAGIQESEFVSEWRMWANVAVDHRVADGASAAKFLREFEALVESLPQRI